MIFDNTLICTVTGKSYFIRGQLNCESINVIYLITCSKCLEQYVWSAAKFKIRFRIHKSDIKTEKESVEVPDITIVSVVLMIIPFNTNLRSNLSNKYRLII